MQGVVILNNFHCRGWSLLSLLFVITGGGCSQQWQDPRLRLQQPVCPGSSVTIDDNKTIFMNKDENLQVFSPTGALLSRWGTRGRGPGQLQRPTGIAVMKVDIIISIGIINVFSAINDKICCL